MGLWDLEGPYWVLKINFSSGLLLPPCFCLSSGSGLLSFTHYLVGDVVITFADVGQNGICGHKAPWLTS